MAKFDWCEKTKSGRMNNDGCVRMSTTKEVGGGRQVFCRDRRKLKKRWVRSSAMKMAAKGDADGSIWPELEIRCNSGW
ncbi:hypothetical protein ACLOJK_000199 [Asimina triloba]